MVQHTLLTNKKHNKDVNYPETGTNKRGKRQQGKSDAKQLANHNSVHGYNLDSMFILAGRPPIIKMADRVTASTVNISKHSINSQQAKIDFFMNKIAIDGRKKLAERWYSPTNIFDHSLNHRKNSALYCCLKERYTEC